jgi:GntR family transcriptional regulator
MHRPIYLQVCDALTERIAKGEWKPGQAIPNEIELARSLGISSGTVRKALELMETNRMLTRRQGRGTFVTDPAANGLADRFYGIRGPEGGIRTGTVEVAEIARSVASEDERARLRLDKDDLVWRIRRIRRDRERAFMCEQIALPARLFPQVAADTSTRIVALAHRSGLMLGAARERILLAAVSPETAETLALAPGTPVLVLDRLVHTTDGQPVEWRLAECNVGSGYYLAPITRGTASTA